MQLDLLIILKFIELNLSNKKFFSVYEKNIAILFWLFLINCFEINPTYRASKTIKKTIETNLIIRISILLNQVVICTFSSLTINQIK